MFNKCQILQTFSLIINVVKEGEKKGLNINDKKTEEKVGSMDSPRYKLEIAKSSN